MDLYRYIELEGGDLEKPSVCPTCGSDYISLAYSEDPVYRCGHCGQPFYKKASEGEGKKNAHKVFLNLIMSPHFHAYNGPYAVQLLACFDKQTCELQAEISFKPELDKLPSCEPALLGLLRKVLTPELIADSMKPKDDVFAVLDGDSYSFYLWDEGQQVNIATDEENIKSYALFAPLAKYIKKYYKKNIEIYTHTPWRMKGMKANTSIEGYRWALRRAYQMAKRDDGSRIFDDEWIEQQIKSDDRIKSHINAGHTPETYVDCECW